MRYFVMRLTRGPGWDPARPLREQRLWDEHAAFMDALVAEGFVVLGGTLATGGALLVVDCRSADEAAARFAADPWAPAGLLAIAWIEEWTILLDGRRGC